MLGGEASGGGPGGASPGGESVSSPTASSTPGKRISSKRQQQIALLMLDDGTVDPVEFQDELRDKVLLCFDDPNYHPGAKCLSLMIMGLIVLSIVGICAETVEELADDWGPTLGWMEHICVWAFTAEYVCRFACSRKKWRFARQYLNMVDLLAVLPYYLELFDVGGGLQAVRLIRVLRVMKMSKYSSGVGVLVTALQVSLQPLMVLVFFVIIAVIVFSSLLYYTERADPDTLFISIPDTFWWSFVTMTTVGYGDMVPMTTWGMALGCLVMLCGVLLLALPITVIGANFAKALRDAQVLAMEQALRDADSDQSGVVTIDEMEAVLKTLARHGGGKEMMLGRGGTIHDLLEKYDVDGSGSFNSAEMERIMNDFQMLSAGASAFQLDKIEEVRMLPDEQMAEVMARIETADQRLRELHSVLAPVLGRAA